MSHDPVTSPDPTTPSDPTKLPPQPLPDVDTLGFWESLRGGVLSICRCTSCRRWIHPPLEACKDCAMPTSYEPVAGRGTIYTYIVVRHPSVRGYTTALPYVVALIDLDEQPGLRLPARIDGCEPEDVFIGQRVRAEVVDLPGSNFRVAVFRPEASISASLRGSPVPS